MPSGLSVLLRERGLDVPKGFVPANSLITSSAYTSNNTGAAMLKNITLGQYYPTDLCSQTGPRVKIL